MFVLFYPYNHNYKEHTALVKNIRHLYFFYLSEILLFVLFFIDYRHYI